MMLRRLRRLGEYVHRFGMPAAARHYLGSWLGARHVVRIGIVHALKLAEWRTVVVPGVQVRILAADEALAYTLAGHHGFAVGDARPLLARGDVCYAGFIDGVPVCSAWYSLGPLLQFGAMIAPPEWAYWGHRVHTNSAFRGRNFQTAIKSVAFEDFVSRGYREILNSIEWTNDASLRLHRRLGYRRIGRIYFTGTEHRGVTWIRVPDAAGIRRVARMAAGA